MLLRKVNFVDTKAEPELVSILVVANWGDGPNVTPDMQWCHIWAIDHIGAGDEAIEKRQLQ